MSIADQSSFAVVATTFATDIINRFEPGSIFAIRCRPYDEVTLDVPAGASLTISTASIGLASSKKTALQYRPHLGAPAYLVCTFDGLVNTVSGLGLTCEGPRSFKLSVWIDDEDDDDDEASDHHAIVNVFGNVSFAAARIMSSNLGIGEAAADTRALINDTGSAEEADDYTSSTSRQAGSVTTSSNTSVVEQFADAEEKVETTPTERHNRLLSNTNDEHSDSDERIESIVNWLPAETQDHLRWLHTRPEPSDGNANASIVDDVGTPAESLIPSAQHLYSPEVDAVDASSNESAIDPVDKSLHSGESQVNKRELNSVREAINEFWLLDSEDRRSPPQRHTTRHQEVQDVGDQEDQVTLNTPVLNALGNTEGNSGTTTSKKISVEKLSSDNTPTKYSRRKRKENRGKSRSGLRTTDLVVGNGRSVKTGRKVGVIYQGMRDGMMLTKRHKSPLLFIQGEGNVIKGLELGVVGMRAGGTRNIVVPPELGYGKDGFNATLVFTATVVSVQKAYMYGR